MIWTCYRRTSFHKHSEQSYLIRRKHQNCAKFLINYCHIYNNLEAVLYLINTELPSKVKPSEQSSPRSPQPPELPPFPTDPEGSTSQEAGNQASPMIKFGQDVRILSLHMRKKNNLEQTI